MRSGKWVSGLAILCLLVLPVAFASNGNGNGNGNGNNGNGNGNGHGPRPTPGLEVAMLTGLGSIGYMGFQVLKARKNSKK